MNFEKELAKAVSYKEQGKYEKAKAILNKMLGNSAMHPDIYKIHNELGLICLMQNDPRQAITYLNTAVQANSKWEEIHNNLGTAYTMLRTYDKAEACFLRAIELKPDYITAYRNIATLFKLDENNEAAIAWFEKILKIQPDHIYALTTLGKIHSTLEEFDKAQSYLLQVLQADDTNAEAYLLLGSSYSSQGKYVQALRYYQKAAQYQPDSQDILNNLAGTYKNLRMNDKARESYNKIFTKADIDPAIYSNYLFYANGDSAFSDKELYQMHKKYIDLYGRKVTPYYLKNGHKEHNKIRVGYISPDFRTHSVAYFAAAPLMFYDKNHFEVYCYSDTYKIDKVTAQLQQAVDHWQDTRKLSHEELSELIITDEIDILVDLAGHTANNRMGVFLNKPAPIQVTWIGYPNTTGLDTMDYRIVDYHTDPVGLTDQYYTEKLIRLPESFLCYTAGGILPEVSELPALHNDYITFGCFNNFGKITDEVLTCWGEILRQIPNSKLMLKSSVGSDAEMAEFLAESFQRCGIDMSRVIQEPYKVSIVNHLETYHEVDIALDCFIYHGTTTTCEALCMGVPVITLEGQRHASRVGVSILSNVGLSELIAKSPVDYVKLAVDLAGNIDRLGAMRKKLRNKINQSTLMQPKRFMKQLEKVYQYMVQGDGNMQEKIVQENIIPGEETLAALLKIVDLLIKESKQLSEKAHQLTVEDVTLAVSGIMNSIPKVQETVLGNFPKEQNLHILFTKQMNQCLKLLFETCQEKNKNQTRDIIDNILLPILHTARQIIEKYYIEKIQDSDLLVSDLEQLCNVHDSSQLVNLLDMFNQIINQIENIIIKENLSEASNTSRQKIYDAIKAISFLQEKVLKTYSQESKLQLIVEDKINKILGLLSETLDSATIQDAFVILKELLLPLLIKINKAIKSSYLASINPKEFEPKVQTEITNKDDGRKLHIGGIMKMPGWEIFNAIDDTYVDHLGNAADLSRFEDETFSVLYSSHVVEHFDFVQELFNVLKEWYRVLKPGGKLYVSVPDLSILSELFISKDLTIDERYQVMTMMFGGHVSEYDYHKVGLNTDFLVSFLLQAGFTPIHKVNEFNIFQDTSSMRFKGRLISLNLVAIKPN